MTETSLKQIWVDADTCPKVIKDILYRAGDLVITADIPLAAKVIDKGR